MAQPGRCNGTTKRDGAGPTFAGSCLAVPKPTPYEKPGDLLALPAGRTLSEPSGENLYSGPAAVGLFRYLLFWITANTMVSVFLEHLGALSGPSPANSERGRRPEAAVYEKPTFPETGAFAKGSPVAPVA